MRRTARRRRHVMNVSAAVVSAFLILWTLIPIYNIVLIALKGESDVFSDEVFPADPTLESFKVVVTQSHWYLEHFWHQFRNSIFIAAMVTLLVLTIGTLTTFLGRPDADPQRLACHQCRIVDLHDPGLVPGDPVLSDYEALRVAG